MKEMSGQFHRAKAGNNGNGDSLRPVKQGVLIHYGLIGTESLRAVNKGHASTARAFGAKIADAKRSAGKMGHQGRVLYQ